MRLDRVRFTVQRMMVAAAAVGLALGIIVETARLQRRRSRCRSLASYCGRMESYYVGLTSQSRKRGHRGTPSLELKAALFGRLKREHEEAATYFWRPMPEDPPPPSTGSE